MRHCAARSSSRPSARRADTLWGSRAIRLQKGPPRVVEPSHLSEADTELHVASDHGGPQADPDRRIVRPPPRDGRRPAAPHPTTAAAGSDWREVRGLAPERHRIGPHGVSHEGLHSEGQHDERKRGAAEPPCSGAGTHQPGIEPPIPAPAARHRPMLADRHDVRPSVRPGRVPPATMTAPAAAETRISRSRPATRRAEPGRPRRSSPRPRRWRTARAPRAGRQQARLHGRGSAHWGSP